MAKDKTKTSKTLVLLDAHAILHRAFHALPDFTSPQGEPTGALYGVVAMLLKLIEDLKPNFIAACYDLPKPTYRHEAYADYKAGRAKTDDALVKQIERSRDIFQAFNIPVFAEPGFEADDLLGTISKQLQTEKDLRVVIASGDMDTLQCVEGRRVVVYTLKKGLYDTILYDESAVRERFGFSPSLVPDYKGLRGDPSDNIPGIPGIGEKTATELITQFGGIEAIYRQLKKTEQKFIEAGIKPRIINLLKENEEEAEFSKMLATIRTDAPVTYEIPPTDWKQAVDTEAVLKLFAELGFRTLATRVKSIFALADDVIPTAAAGGVSEAEIREVSVLLWLVESERTNASYDDIIDYGRTYFETIDFKDIRQRLLAKVRDQKLITVWEQIEQPLLPVISTLNQTGVTLDVVYLKSLSKKMHRELTTLQKNVFTLAGLEFNLNSPKQLGDVLFDKLGLKPKQQKKTATGQRSTRESELEKMKGDHPIIPHLLRYRELQKLVSTYINNLPGMVSTDGRLRTTFLQTGAVTGRMASQNPGLQNIPVRTEESKSIRRAFVASPGYTLVSIDYSQIELRVAAILSGDQALIEIFKHGEDVHAGVAARVFQVKQSEVTSEMRRKAKVINFGILYGMGVVALRQNLGEGTSREEAQEFLNAYFTTFTRLAEYLEETKDFARLHGYTTTMFGRRRHFPSITSSVPFIKASAERMAINAPVQGTAADVMRLAMIAVHQHIQNRCDTAVRMLLQVHDELVFEIRNDCLESEARELQKIMEGVLSKQKTHGVPILCDVEVGPNWADLKKMA